MIGGPDRPRGESNLVGFSDPLKSTVIVRFATTALGLYKIYIHLLLLLLLLLDLFNGLFSKTTWFMCKPVPER